MAPQRTLLQRVRARPAQRRVELDPNDAEPPTQRRAPTLDVGLQRELTRGGRIEPLPIALWLASDPQPSTDRRAALRERLETELGIGVDRELADPPLLLARASPTQIHALSAFTEIAAISLYEIEAEESLGRDER